MTLMVMLTLWLPGGLDGGWWDTRERGTVSCAGSRSLVTVVAAAGTTTPTSRLGIISNAIASDPDAVLAPPMRLSAKHGLVLGIPLEVKAGMEVLQIVEIDELRKSFKADIIFTTSWVDPLLDLPAAFEGLPEGSTIDIKEFCEDDMCLRFPFFVPDIQFLNMYEVFHPTLPISLVTLGRNGLVTKSIKMSGLFTLHGMDMSVRDLCVCVCVCVCDTTLGCTYGMRPSTHTHIRVCLRDVCESTPPITRVHVC